MDSSLFVSSISSSCVGVEVEGNTFILSASVSRLYDPYMEKVHWYIQIAEIRGG